ncbi:hypothetical protein [Paenarthrobacter sp. DKR-5]|nr:hypothetical protein [Paenarthrobacter sp. DKR-5]
MEVLVFLGIVAVAAAGVVWGRRTFRHEIDRAKKIRRANRNGR